MGLRIDLHSTSIGLSLAVLRRHIILENTWSCGLEGRATAQEWQRVVPTLSKDAANRCVAIVGEDSSQ